MKQLIEKFNIKYGWTTDANTILTLSLEQMEKLTIEELREYTAALEQEFGEDGSLEFEHIPSTPDGYPIYDGVDA